jgi:hypothetical protein
LVLPTDNFVEGVEYSKEELDAVFDNDFQIALTSADELLEEIDPNEKFTTIRGLICEMCFQLGKPRVMKFKKMWEGIRAADYNKAADEMIESNWHKQTTKRCEEPSWYNEELRMIHLLKIFNNPLTKMVINKATDHFKHKAEKTKSN